jgi:hypothetical protein
LKLLNRTISLWQETSQDNAAFRFVQQRATHKKSGEARASPPFTLRWILPTDYIE